MLSQLRRLARFPLHLPFLGLYSVLSLAAVNRPEIRLLDTAGVLIAVSSACILLTIAIRLISKSYHKVLLFVSIVGVIFFSYGHVYEMLRGVTLGGLLLGRYRFLLPAALLLGFAFYLSLRRLGSDGAKETALFNTVGLVLLVFPLLTLLRYELVSGRREPASIADFSLQLDPSAKERPPDIYYIILDSYAREDVLRDLYNFDNQPFRASLESLGFYVASQSLANYPSTNFSLASSLNLDYIQDLNIEMPPRSYPGPLIDLIRDSRVSRLLKELGYRVVATASGTTPTSLTDADVFLTPETALSDSKIQQAASTLNPFEEMYLRTTMLAIPIDLALARQNSLAAEWITNRTGAERHRVLVLSAFSGLGQMNAIPGPKFVFSHIVSPHFPYLFSASGEELFQTEAFTLEDTSTLEAAPEDFVRYRDQLLFINQKVLESIQHILANSDQPPVIILQADHGPAFGMDWNHPDPRNIRTKFPILNAYLVPDPCRAQLYSTVTPVNSFRVVLNCLFDAGLPLLDDQAYFVNHHSSEGYEFIPLEAFLQSFQDP